jgi:endonuclease I
MGLQKRDIVSGLLVLALSISLGCSKRSGQGTTPQPKAPSAKTATPAPAPAAPGATAQAAAVDTEKPVSEVQAQAQTMSVDSLRATALKYKDVIVAKQAELQKLTAKIKEIPIADALSQETKTLKTDLQNLQTSVSALKERFGVYYDTLKKKGGDLSNLTL